MSKDIVIMEKFIQLTELETRKPVIINSNHIVIIASKGKGSKVLLTDNWDIEVTESLDYFKTML